MRLKVLGALAFGIVGFAVTAAPVDDTDPDPPAQPTTFPGRATVKYFNESGAIVSETSIPSGSTFYRGSGGTKVPCEYTYYADDDGDHLTDPDAVPETRLSYQWRFTETTQQGQSLSDEDWAALAGMSGSSVEEVVSVYGEVDSAYRRFNVACVGQHGSGQPAITRLQTAVLVSIRDDFWQLEQAIATLRDGVVLDRPRVATIPDGSMFGGLPVNMPASLQIDALPWQVYPSGSEVHRGYVSRLLVRPSRLEFTLAFVPDLGIPETLTVPCLDDFTDEPDDGNIPRRDPTVPDFAEPGQYMGPCVWTPPRPGNVTIRATVAYSVTLVVAGPPGTFVEPEEPFMWSSDPVTLRVDELRAVNVVPGGGRSG